jgi:hypothetical protein
MGKIDRALWAGFAALLLLTGIYLLLRENENNALRIILTVLALLVPVGLAAFLDDTFKWRTLPGQLPPVSILLLSTALGVSIWPLGRWLSENAGKFLFDHVGYYFPPFVTIDPWGLQIGYQVVLLPLAIGLVVFGAMRVYLTGAPFLRSLLVMLLLFGLLGAVTSSQGLASFPGYAVLGLAAGFVALRMRSLWPAVAMTGAYAYAELAFFDQLFMEMQDLSYSDTKWLLLVLFSGFVSIVLLQVIRFRSAAPPPGNSDDDLMTLMGWLVAGLVVLVFAVYVASEFDQRNTVTEAPPDPSLTDEAP